MKFLCGGKNITPNSKFIEKDYLHEPINTYQYSNSDVSTLLTLAGCIRNNKVDSLLSFFLFTTGECTIKTTNSVLESINGVSPSQLVNNIQSHIRVAFLNTSDSHKKEKLKEAKSMLNFVNKPF